MLGPANAVGWDLRDGRQQNKCLLRDGISEFVGCAGLFSTRAHRDGGSGRLGAV